MNHTTKTTASERIILILVLALTFALGMVRVAITPLWMHYDEASHYDYTRYLITHRALPKPNHPDPAIIEYLSDLDPTRRYELGICLTVQEPRHVCWMPAQQFDEMPAYYILQAAVLSIVRPNTLAGELALARTVSVMLSVGVGVIMYALIKYLFPNQRLLAIAVPLIMGLNFAFIDLMSAINNDAGAIFAFHLMLLAVVYTINRGFSWISATLLAVSLALCVLTKSSAWIGIPIAMLGAGIALTSRLRFRWHFAILALLALIAAPFVFYWKPDVGILLRPAIDDRMPLFLRVNFRLVGWYDPQNWPIYWPAIRWQVITFWSAYANGQAGLPIGGVSIFGALMLASAAGLARLAITKRSSLTRAQLQSLLFLGLAITLALLMSLLRIDPPNKNGVIFYIPTARHFYIVAGPVMMLFVLGLGAWVSPKYRRIALASLALLLYILSLWSLIGVQMAWFIPYR